MPSWLRPLETNLTRLVAEDGSQLFSNSTRPNEQCLGFLGGMNNWRLVVAWREETLPFESCFGPFRSIFSTPCIENLFYDHPLPEERADLTNFWSITFHLNRLDSQEDGKARVSICYDCSANRRVMHNKRNASGHWCQCSLLLAPLLFITCKWQALCFASWISFSQVSA